MGSLFLCTHLLMVTEVSQAYDYFTYLKVQTVEYKKVKVPALFCKVSLTNKYYEVVLALLMYKLPITKLEMIREFWDPLAL